MHTGAPLSQKRFLLLFIVLDIYNFGMSVDQKQKDSYKKEGGSFLALSVSNYRLTEKVCFI